MSCMIRSTLSRFGFPRSPRPWSIKSWGNAVFNPHSPFFFPQFPFSSSSLFRRVFSLPPLHHPIGSCLIEHYSRSKSWGTEKAARETRVEGSHPVPVLDSLGIRRRKVTTLRRKASHIFRILFQRFFSRKE